MRIIYILKNKGKSSLILQQLKVLVGITLENSYSISTSYYFLYKQLNTSKDKLCCKACQKM